MKSETALRQRIIEILTEIAPEVDPAVVRDDVQFRKQFVFDSVDFLNFADRLQSEFGLSIPEIDYPMLATLNGCLDYLSAKRPPDAS